MVNQVAGVEKEIGIEAFHHRADAHLDLGAGAAVADHDRAQTALPRPRRRTKVQVLARIEKLLAGKHRVAIATGRPQTLQHDPLVRAPNADLLDNPSILPDVTNPALPWRIHHPEDLYRGLAQALEIGTAQQLRRSRIIARGQRQPARKQERKKQ